jgi:hypothetical protein
VPEDRDTTGEAGGDIAGYDLDELPDQMDPDTFHDEVDLGPPVGNEVW